MSTSFWQALTSNRALLGAFALLQLAAAWLLAVPGHLSVDEATYNLMLESLTAHGTLGVWNGFEERPSIELTSRFVKPYGEHLSAQYPYFGTLLAAPLYVHFGFRGLPPLGGPQGVRRAHRGDVARPRKQWDPRGVDDDAARERRFRPHGAVQPLRARNLACARRSSRCIAKCDAP